uniref:Uncharacterized protein n=1 Tax=Arundo donax TaxID=35708 RepID=A0A0A9AET6_ARUDO
MIFYLLLWKPLNHVKRQLNFHPRRLPGLIHVSYRLLNS